MGDAGLKRLRMSSLIASTLERVTTAAAKGTALIRAAANPGSSPRRSSFIALPPETTLWLHPSLNSGCHRHLFVARGGRDRSRPCEPPDSQSPCGLSQPTFGGDGSRSG